MAIYSLGINPGHGFCKGVLLREDGTEKGVTFPALVVPEPGDAAGLDTIPIVPIDGRQYRTGYEAMHLQGESTLTGMERLSSDYFIPALVQRMFLELKFPPENGKRTSLVYGVSGLPGEWSRYRDRCQMLVNHIRRIYPFPEKTLSIIGEPLGLAFSVILDKFGAYTDAATGTIFVIDIGFFSVDTCEIVEGKRINPKSLTTYPLGAKRPVAKLVSSLSADFNGRYFDMHTANEAANNGYITLAGQPEPLPFGWDDPLWENGQALVAHLKNEIGDGLRYDLIIVGGGGAEQRWFMEPLRQAFSHIMVPEEPQRAIARGMARRARRMAHEAQ